MTTPITRLNAALEGRYSIERELGEGGMATVYLAHDVRHNRKVALKVLKPELAAMIGGERFLVEIQTTANLQHPHILPLFDSGEEDGFLFYVMPYVEGENLREKLDREQQLGVDESIRIARAIASALDYAHRNDIVHRDIKPENILLHDGNPVVADFGIAIALSAAGGGRMTETGLSLGTPHYMSPEQATAERDLTARSDVYSLGCVLYEMLAGDPPHTGPTAQAILVRILTEDPRSVTDVRTSAPPHVGAVLAKALEKLPADRFDSADAFAKALDDETFTYARRTRAQTAAVSTPAPAAVLAGRTNPRALTATAAVAVLAIGLAAWGWLRPTADPAVPIRSIIDLADISLSAIDEVLISPDGSRLAVIGIGDAGRAIYWRNAEEESFRVIPGTEGDPRFISFSPGSDWLVYGGEALNRVALAGGAPRPVVPAGTTTPPRDPHWGEDGLIVFTEQGGNGLYLVSEDGGEPRLVQDSVVVRNPRLLPGSRLIIATRVSSGSTVLIDAETGAEEEELIAAGVDATYVDTGHLLYTDLAGGLWAVSFDPGDGAATGEPVPIFGGLSVTRRVFAHYSVSKTGSLVYGAGAGGESPSGRSIVTVDMAGNEVVDVLAPRLFSELRWSPDGEWVAYSGSGRSVEETDIYIYNIAVGSLPRPLTSEGDNELPIWSPDGTRVVFSSSRAGTNGHDLFVKGVFDDAPPERLTSLPGEEEPTDWPSADLLLFADGSGANRNLWTYDLATDSVSPYHLQEGRQVDAVLSPEGDLAAYASNETGDVEVYVRSFPLAREPTIVSEGGGTSPRWSPDGETLYYWRPGNPPTLMAASIRRDPATAVVQRDEVLQANYVTFTWDLHPDGDRLVAAQNSELATGAAADSDGTAERQVLYTNFFEELRRGGEGTEHGAPPTMTDTAARLNAALEGLYTIERELGEGGMATVYLAHDVRHRRNVALKVLRPELAALMGAERFLAEITTTANLQHPHILPLFDSGEADGFLFYVMPSVDGETLRERINREKQLSVEDAVALATKVADALDYAHENGVVHRDIKPGNILLSERGEPLVADFGIALAVAQAGAGRMTETGLSLGTPHYMSPEQATGDREVDPRSDLYSLACVLYEMLAGEPPFSATTAQAVLAKILTTDAPSITMARRTVPPNVGAALAKALEKLPADRFASVAEFAKALADPAFIYEARARTGVSGIGRVSTGAGQGAPGVDRRLFAGVAGIALVAVVLAAWGWWSPSASEQPAVGYTLELTGLTVFDVAISRDGRRFAAHAADADGSRGLYHRDSDQVGWEALPALQGLIRNGISFSPNGESVAFKSGPALRKVPLGGGPAEEFGRGLGLHWGLNGDIVFRSQGDRGLYRARSVGGEPDLIFESDSIRVAFPHLLPGGEGVLFSTATGGDPLSGRVFVLDLGSGEARQVVASGNSPRYVSPGYVVFVHADQGLMGIPFDLATMSATGPAVPLGLQVPVRSNGDAVFDVSDTGTLVYGESLDSQVAGGPLAWFDLEGVATPIPVEAESPTHPRVSPDGNQIAFTSDSNIVIHDLATGVDRRLTFEGVNQFPLWSADGEFIYFLSERPGTNALDGFRKAVDGSTGAERLWTAQDERSLMSVSGRWLVVSLGTSDNVDSNDIALFDLASDTTTGLVPYLETPEAESEATVSPDGRWLAYWNGTTEALMVRGFPEPIGIWEVDDGEGRASEPVWAPDGSALYYVTTEGVARVDVVEGSSFERGRPSLQFALPLIPGGTGRPLDIHPDGDRFVIAGTGTSGGGIAATGANVDKVWVVTNWFQDLERRMSGN